MAKRTPRVIALSLLLYRWLLRLGPDEFYDEYAREALQVFRQCCLDAYRQQRVSGVLRLWPAMLGETLTGMLAEQGNTLRLILHPRLLWPVALALTCILFPFFWLSRTWPLFGTLFNFIFSTPLAYFTGHVLLFCGASLSILLCIPKLRQHPLYYILCLMPGAFAEEFIQVMFNSHPGLHKDARNLLLDLAGILLAYFVLRLWHSRRASRKYPSSASFPMPKNYRTH